VPPGTQYQHLYAQPGLYHLRVTVTFNQAQCPGFTVAASHVVVEIYDPTAATRTVTPTATVTLTPTTTSGSFSRLEGRVTFQGRGTPPQSSWVQQLQVRFYLPGGTTPVSTRTVTTDSSGHFTLDNVPTGSADVWVKHAQALARRVNQVSFPPGLSATVDFGLLPTGDSDNNNLVDIVDFSVLRSLFGLGSQTCGTAVPNPLPCADFDGSGQVDIVDFSLLRANFGQAGA
jgi:hypothetical protein